MAPPRTDNEEGMVGWVKADGYTSLVRVCVYVCVCVCARVCVGGEVFLDDPPARIGSSVFLGCSCYFAGQKLPAGSI